jgi:hypothetical protein
MDVARDVKTRDELIKLVRTYIYHSNAKSNICCRTNLDPTKLLIPIELQSV